MAWSKSLCPDPQKTYNINVKSEEKNVTNLYMFHSNLSIQILAKFFGGQIHKMYVKFSSFFFKQFKFIITAVEYFFSNAFSLYCMLEKRGVMAFNLYQS